MSITSDELASCDLQLVMHERLYRRGGRSMLVKDLPMIKYIEKTINGVVADEIEKGLLNEEAPKEIKLPIDELLGDTIIALLDALSLSSYILEKDIEGEFLTLQIDEKRCLNRYRVELDGWKSERDELVKEFFSNKGVY